MVAERLKSPAAGGKKPRLMFQDEARFGRMSRPRRCWAPPGTRPTMQNGYEREFTYVYGAVSPMEGTLDYRLCAKMNTEEMGVFLQQVSQQYPDEYLLMVLDGASSHKAKALEVPPNMALIALPGYSPQLNPQENVWDEIREKNFPNRVYDSMSAVRDQLLKGLAEFVTKVFWLPCRFGAEGSAKKCTAVFVPVPIRSMVVLDVAVMSTFTKGTATDRSNRSRMP